MTKKPFLIGIVGSMALSALYISFLIFIGGLEHAIGFIQSLWYWLALIIIGFGTQLGLYSYIRGKIRSKSATAELSSSMGVSTGTMIACCLHLAADLLPIIGLSAATIFLTQFQTPLLLTGVFSNLIGVIFMISEIKQHGLSKAGGFIDKLPIRNSKKVIAGLVMVSALIIGSSVLFAQGTSPVKDLDEQSQTSNKVTFSVTPLIDGGKSIDFEISMNTHSVNLDFIMTEIASLKVNGGEFVNAVAWNGDSSGGHHRSGTLTFLNENHDIRDIILVINPKSRRFKELTFQWEI